MKWLLGSGAAVLLAMSIVGVTWAHAEPATAKPGDGAVLLRSPGEIVLVMSQEMGRLGGSNDIDVFDASGKEVTTIAAVVDNADRKRLSVAVPSELAAGNYRVKWKTLSSEDGDPADGTISFTIDPTGTPSPGKETLRADLLGGGETPAAGTGVAISGPDDGVTWVLVVAVGIGMLVLGAGGTFLLVQKKE